MIDFLGAVVAAFGVVFIAELGDKTQILALGYGTQYPLRVVAIGLTLGYAAAGVLATIVGGVLGAALPERPVQIVSGLVFVAFAALAVRGALHSDDEANASATVGRPISQTATTAVIGSIALTIAIAEMGDKTQITTATLASQSSPLGVWIGATLGAASSGMIGAAAGRTIGHRISARAINWTSAAIFAAFGVAMLAGWF